LKTAHPFISTHAQYEEIAKIASECQPLVRERHFLTPAGIDIEAFRTILEDVLEEENLAINESTRAKDVPSWDSLNHVRLLVHIERTYGISFPVDSVERLQNVGELIGLINHLMDQQTGR